MEIVVVGLNHRGASLEVREKLDFSKYPSEAYLKRLAGTRSVESGVVLSTCNRVEVYAAGTTSDDVVRDSIQFLSEFHDLKEGDFSKLLYSKSNREAVKHLFRVASSLDSMVMGEPQIVGQIKEAFYLASHEAFINPFLDRLFRKAFSVSKRVRSETKIAEQAVSISFAAVELAKRIFNDLKDESVIVLGAGEMAELAAKHLKGSGVREIYFASRSFDHAFELAKDYGGISLPLDRFPDYLPKADIVIVSTASPTYVITLAQVKSAMELRRQEPMFLIDISVPRNVDPAVNELENVYLYNIDDLQNVVTENMKNRQLEAAKAEAIVEMEVEQFFRSLEKLEAAPTIAALKEKFEDFGKVELDRVKKRLKNVTDEEIKQVERSFESLISKILADPVSYLKEERGGGSRGRAFDIRKIFGLDTKKDEK